MHALVDGLLAELTTIADTELGGRRELEVELGIHHRRIPGDRQASDGEGSTARSNLISIFSKTGTSQQNELVSLLKGIAPMGKKGRFIER